MILVMDVGKEGSNSHRFSWTSVIVAPGMQQVVASKNLMFLIMESPMMRVVGENEAARA